MRAILFACLLSLLALPARAQDAPRSASQETAPQPTFRTGVGLVRVDVTVTGRNDRPIEDLTIEDFEIREDGVPQTIQSMQFIRMAQGPDADAAPIRSADHAAIEAGREDVRLLVIFLDDYHLRYGPQYDAQLKRMLRGFVEAEMLPTDLFAVVGPLTPISDLGLTRDKQEILKRIDAFQGRLGGFVPPRSPIEESHEYLPFGQRMRIRSEVTLSALEAVALHLGALREGRKSVLFISEGPSMYADGLNLFGTLRRVTTAANTSNVTIHTLDPRGLGPHTVRSAANDTLAAETGGRRLQQSNDYSKGLRAVLNDASAYYLLGYAPARDPADGKFHEIDVRVRRKGVRVLARKGYWAPKPEDMRPPDRPRAPTEITRALEDVGDSARPRLVRDWIGVGPLEDGRSAITFLAEPTAAFSSRPGAQAVQLKTLGPDGKPVATHDVSRDEDPPLWASRFTADPGVLNLRVSIVDAEGGELEGWTHEVRVPDASDPAAALGTPVVISADSPSAFRALSVSDEAVPTLGREFRRTQRVLVRLPLRRDVAAGHTIVAELVNGQGDILRQLPVTRGTSGAEVELPVANLAQAEYVLRFTLRRGSERATKLVPFAIVR